MKAEAGAPSALLREVETMNKPKDYVMSNPEMSVESLGWRVYITSRVDIESFLRALPTVRTVLDSFGVNTYEVYLSPLYDRDDAWLMVAEALDGYFQDMRTEVELNPDVWDF
jgi:hypothetical protein